MKRYHLLIAMFIAVFLLDGAWPQLANAKAPSNHASGHVLRQVLITCVDTGERTREHRDEVTTGGQGSFDDDNDHLRQCRGRTFVSGHLQFLATGVYSDGSLVDLTKEVTWSATDLRRGDGDDDTAPDPPAQPAIAPSAAVPTPVAVISNVAEYNGFFTALAVGQTRVIATTGNGITSNGITIITGICPPPICGGNLTFLDLGNVSNPRMDPDVGASVQNEPSIAAGVVIQVVTNPITGSSTTFQQQRFVVSYNDDSGTGSAAGWSTSDDFGVTWIRKGPLPPSIAGKDSGGQPNLVSFLPDTWVTGEESSLVLFAASGITPRSTGFADALYVAISTDSGQSFPIAAPINVVDEANPNTGRMTLKPSIDFHYGLAAAAWISSIAVSDVIPGEIRFSTSDDGGQTWEAPEALIAPRHGTDVDNIMLNPVIRVGEHTDAAGKPDTLYIGFQSHSHSFFFGSVTSEAVHLYRLTRRCGDHGCEWDLVPIFEIPVESDPQMAETHRILCSGSNGYGDGVDQCDTGNASQPYPAQIMVGFSTTKVALRAQTGLFVAMRSRTADLSAANAPADFNHWTLRVYSTDSDETIDCLNTQCEGGGWGINYPIPGPRTRTATRSNRKTITSSRTLPQRGFLYRVNSSTSVLRGIAGLPQMGRATAFCSLKGPNLQTMALLTARFSTCPIQPPKHGVGSRVHRHHWMVTRSAITS